MGVSGQDEKSLSPKTQKNDEDNAIRKIINKPLGICARSTSLCSPQVLQPSWALRPPSSRRESSGHSQTSSTRTLPQAARPRCRGSTFAVVQQVVHPPGAGSDLRSGPALRQGGVPSRSARALPSTTGPRGGPHRVLRRCWNLWSLWALPAGAQEASTAPHRDEPPVWAFPSPVSPAAGVCCLLSCKNASKSEPHVISSLFR